MMRSASTIGTGLAAMALFRAIESYRPEEERLLDDRFARNILPPLWRVFLLPGLRHALIAMTERRGPGALGNLFCRTRYIDDALCNALAQGAGQVVILGAGFDCRPYRIPGIDRTRVFEVDLPAPQCLKWERLQKIFGALPAHVTLVPTDFNQQGLADAMKVAGFCTEARTFFIWEGVTQYITAAAVNAIFRYVSRAAAAGSEIAFTYIHRGIIDGSARSEADQRFVTLTQRARSPWIFGLDPAEVTPYLAARGFKVVEHVGTPEYRARYLAPRGRRMNIFEGERVVLAQTTGAPPNK